MKHFFLLRFLALIAAKQIPQKYFFRNRAAEKKLTDPFMLSSALATLSREMERTNWLFLHLLRLSNSF